MTKFLSIVFLLGCLSATYTHADSTTSYTIETDSEQSCLSHTTEIDSLTVANTELVKLVDDIMNQLEAKTIEFTTAETKWRGVSEASEVLERAVGEKNTLLLQARDQLLAAVEEIKTTRDAVDAAGALATAGEQGKLEAEAGWAQAVAEREQAASALQESKERGLEAQLDLSGCVQQAAELEGALISSQQRVARMTPLLEEAVGDLKRHQQGAREALQTMKTTCEAEVAACTCDFSRCQEAALRFSGLDQLAVAGAAGLWRQISSFSAAAGALYGRHVDTLYSRYLAQHVEAGMQTDVVRKYVDYFDYLEGKGHVFLYYLWKDTPRVVVKVIQEVQYLCYFAHWKGNQAVAGVAVMARDGLVSLGLGGVDLVVLEGSIYLLAATILLLCLIYIRTQLWSIIAWIIGALCAVLLCPYWILTKPFRVVYGLLFVVREQDNVTHTLE